MEDRLKLLQAEEAKARRDAELAEMASEVAAKLARDVRTEAVAVWTSTRAALLAVHEAKDGRQEMLSGLLGRPGRIAVSRGSWLRKPWGHPTMIWGPR